MKTLKRTVEETRENLAVRGVVEVYEQVAATKMQQIRNDIIVSREFFEGLAKLSHDVGADFSLVSEEGKKTMATVFISANTGLYGDIVRKTFNDFLKFIRNNQTDIYIVGRVGERMLKTHAPEIHYQMIDISDEKVEEEKFVAITKQLLGYRKINVFYGKFNSVVSQDPFKAAISGEIVKEIQAKQEKTWQKKLAYLYEPSLKDITELFTNEIMASVFEQTLRESQLAKHASRLMLLDEAIEKIDERVKKLNYLGIRIRKLSEDKKQRQTICGLMSRGVL